MTVAELRPGEQRLDVDPARQAPDAGLVFIGRVHSAWREGETPPRNLTQARARSHEPGSSHPWIEIDKTYRPALRGLQGYSHVVVLGWLHRARRDLAIIQPAHLAAPAGVLALRSPVRPNPISLSVLRLIGVDESTGRVTVDAIDLLDGTPVVDLKPYRPGIDAVPDAVVP